MTHKEIQHLYWRAGFGISPDRLKKSYKKTRAYLVKELFDASTKEYRFTDPLIEWVI